MTRRTEARLVCAALVAGAVAGVAALAASPAQVARAHLPGRITFGHSVRGAPLRAVRLGGANARRKALVVGVIHGDEPAGLRVVRQLRRSHGDIRGVQLWVIKTVNPDGVAASTRKNAHGVDLNRNFSFHWRDGVARSSGYYPGPHPFSEPETRAVRRLIRRVRPRVTIWYHQPWGQVLLPCHGAARVQKRYARIAQSPTKRCRGAHLPGTATSWQNHHFRGTAFVVELPGGALSARRARLNARAAAAVARPRNRQASAKVATRVRRLPRPRFDRDPIPYGHRRKHEMASYSRRHYGRRGWRLRHPHVIVLHFTDGPDYRSAWNEFASNAPSMGELPGVCSHFVISQNGRIHRAVPPGIKCRHTIGLNYTAIGVEMVQEEGRGAHWADRQILRRGPQIHSALHLVGWLRQRFGIKMRNVIGHAMANRSPYFVDREGWRNDHDDWKRRDVRTFRHRLRRLLRR
jgi:murein peptide amidase A